MLVAKHSLISFFCFNLSVYEDSESDSDSDSDALTVTTVTVPGSMEYTWSSKYYPCSGVRYDYIRPDGCVSCIFFTEVCHTFRAPSGTCFFQSVSYSLREIL
jgi:hypothetical protein